MYFVIKMGASMNCKKKRKFRRNDESIRELSVLTPWGEDDISSDTEIERDFSEIVAFIENDCNKTLLTTLTSHRTCCTPKSTIVIKSK